MKSLLAARWSQRRALVDALRVARRYALTLRIPRLPLQIVEELPHDPGAFTQGLCYAGDCLLESTGRVGSSSLRRLDPHTGRILQTVAVPDDWAEGIALLGDQVVQLSYRTGIARRYRWPGLQPVRPDYRYNGEGWGLAAVGNRLLMSDGTARLRFLDQDFLEVGELHVHRFGLDLRRINDLAWDGSALFANALREPYLFRLDPARAAITGIVDCRPLIARVRPQSREHVLNGITVAAEPGEFFLTGKCWPVLFRVRIARE